MKALERATLPLSLSKGERNIGEAGLSVNDYGARFRAAAPCVQGSAKAMALN
ncbi:MAG: hypothetical protein ACRD9R_09230 [Pyrinomonadaceae bacterium]